MDIKAIITIEVKDLFTIYNGVMGILVLMLSDWIEVEFNVLNSLRLWDTNSENKFKLNHVVVK